MIKPVVVLMREDVSEAKAMADYLHDTYGISLAHIALEEQSTSTELNFVHSKKILAQQGDCLKSTDNRSHQWFSHLRASLIGKRQGYTNLQVVGSGTPLWYIRPNVWFREYFVFLSAVGYSMSINFTHVPFCKANCLSANCANCRSWWPSTARY